MSIIKSGLVVAIFTFISRIFGLLREIVIGSFFGTNMFADCVNTAFKFPNLFRRIFGEGALASSFVPIYSSDLQVSEARGAKFASEVYTLLFVVLVVLTILIQIFMPQIMTLLAPGFAKDPAKFEMSILLCRITIPYMIFISMSALLGGMLNSHGRFFPFAFVPVILNITIMIACLFKGDDTAMAKYISIGILVGGLCQFLFMYASARQAKIEFKFVRLKTLSRDSWLFLKNMVPATIGSSVTQINLFISQAIASFSPGAISILSYSDRIYQFPLSIIGICFGTVLLPSLSALHKSGEKEEALKLQTKAIKLSLVLSFACVAGIISLAHPIMHIIYERGAFTSLDTIKTADTIAIFAIGLPAFIINKVLTPIFYARLDTRTPLIITIATILCNIIANLLLIKEYEHLGIAIGTSIASWFNVLLLISFCKIHKIQIVESSISKHIIKTLIACFAFSSMLKLIAGSISPILYSHSTLIKFSALLALVGFGIILYFAICFVLRIITRADLKKMFKR